MENEWINRVRNLIIKEDPEFLKRKDECLPRYLVKYRNASEQAIESLENDTMWFDKPSNFNDPYDCSITITGEIVRNYIEQNIKELELKVGKLNSLNTKYLYEFQLAGLISRLNEYIQNSCLISCFSTKINSMLMWSHYADSHKGFCIVYDISEVISNNMVRKNLYPVIYSESKFDIAYYLDDALNAKYPCIASLCWKNVEWSYENEYRLILPCSEGSCQPKLYDFIKPTQVYLGANMDTQDKDRIENIALDKGIKLSHMSCDPQRYVLMANELLWKRRE